MDTVHFTDPVTVKSVAYRTRINRGIGVISAQPAFELINRQTVTAAVLLDGIGVIGRGRVTAVDDMIQAPQIAVLQCAGQPVIARSLEVP